MKGKREKHENEGFYGEKRRENKVSFGKGERRKMMFTAVFYLGNQQNFLV